MMKAASVVNCLVFGLRLCVSAELTIMNQSRTLKTGENNSVCVYVCIKSALCV